MKRSTTSRIKPSRIKPLLSACLVSLCLLGSGFGLAQPILADYQKATEALRSSIEAFPTDQVQSLDTLRQAETAFQTLGAGLELSLRGGLDETFSRAEEAIVNQSETDLQVQAAVLQGGFGRAVYQQALQNAADGELGSAQTLLSALGQDLGFEDTAFAGSSQGALQSAFEARLAARSLEQLETFGGDLGSRYRTLAQLYSYVFLVQDSPRLPPKTRDTVVGAIRSLVAERPTDESINLLRAQLTGFARSAERAEQSATGAQTGRTEDGTDAVTPAAPAGDAATDAAADTAAGAEPFVPPVAGVEPDSVVDADLQPIAPTPSSTPDQPNPTQPTSAAPDTVSSLPFLTQDIRTLIFAAAGLLALIALIRLLFAPSASPWRDAALALLLLPTVVEGLIALVGFLAPLVNQPLLAQAGAYSLFTNPVMPLIWVLLTAIAVLCLAVSWRTGGRKVERVEEAEGAQTERQTERDPTITAQGTYTPRSSPLTTGTLNWDEDF